MSVLLNRALKPSANLTTLPVYWSSSTRVGRSPGKARCSHFDLVARTTHGMSHASTRSIFWFAIDEFAPGDGTFKERMSRLLEPRRDRRLAAIAVELADGVRGEGSAVDHRPESNHEDAVTIMFMAAAALNMILSNKDR